jgi:hypothetical protein
MLRAAAPIIEEDIPRNNMERKDAAVIALIFLIIAGLDAFMHRIVDIGDLIAYIDNKLLLFIPASCPDT